MFAWLKKRFFYVFAILFFVPLVSRSEIYVTVPSPVQTDPKVVTVQEFFWYSCPHCFSLEPQVEEWMRGLPKDVKVEIIPAVSNIYWKKMAVLYYSLQELGLLSKLHKRIFESQHVDHINLYDPDTLKQFLGNSGVNWNDYQNSSNSFGVTTRVRRSEQLVKNYGIDGVPCFVINGHYKVSVETAGSEKGLFDAVNKTINIARGESKH